MKEEIKQPKYNIGQLVIVSSEKDPQKIVQGKIVSAECFYDKGRQGDWFFAIEVPDGSGTNEPERIYSYEKILVMLKQRFLTNK